MNIIELAHRICWRYKHSKDPHHSSTYTFNESTLQQFAKAIRAEREWVDLTDEELAESLGWKLGDPMYMTIVGLGQEAIAAFKEKNK